MTKALAKPQMCVVLFSGKEIWLDDDRAKAIADSCERGAGMVRIDDSMINVSAIEGIFNPQQMDDHRKIKSGMAKCEYMKWHDKFDECTCMTPDGIPPGFIFIKKHGTLHEMLENGDNINNL